MSVFDEPSRRNRLGLHFIDPEKAAPVINALFDVVHAARMKVATKGYGKQEPEVRNHIEQVVVDLYAMWYADPTLYIGYSRGDENFKGDGCYAGKLNGKIFKDIIDSLAAAGYIENHIQDAGQKDKSSRMRGTPKLAALIEDELLSWASISTNPSEGVLILKSEKPKKPKKGSRKEVLFKDSDDLRIPAMRENLEAINKKLEETLINIFVTDDQQADINNRLRKDPDRLALDFTQRKLHRSFVNNSWDEGGRFYGGWWQGVPSEYRQYIQIEGKQTVEWDYSSIHPSILYINAGLPRPIDAYDIPDWDKQYRGLIKKAFNQLINGSEKTKPKTQWFKLAPDTYPDPLPAGWDKMKRGEKAPIRRKAFKKLTGRDYNDLLTDIIKHHKPIDNVFFAQVWGGVAEA